MKLVYIVTGTAALMIGLTTPAAAQENDRAAEVHHRNNCRLAAQVLTLGEPHTRFAWAGDFISNCPEEGPAYFSAQWEAAVADTVALRRLIAGSTRIRDARVFASMRATALDRTRPDAVRVAALIGLTGYAAPSLAVDLTELRVPADPNSRIPLVGGTAADYVHMPGAVRLGSVRMEVETLLNAFASDSAGEPREVWYAAAALAKRLSSRSR